MSRFLVATLAAALVVGVGPATADAAPTKTRVAGVALYTTSNGKHPFARGISVEFRDADGTSGGTLLGTDTTDDVGIFSLDITTKRPDGKARHPFVRALTRSLGFTVHAPGTTAPYAFASTPVTATGATQTVRLTAGAIAVAETAFAVTDALVTGVRYGRRIAGSMPTLSVSYPDPHGTNATPTVMRVTAEDRFDWDVLLHEYGHAVGDQLGISSPIAAVHTFGQNLGEPPRTKSTGVRVAWDEGFATYFSLTAQDVLGVASLKIPGAGDSVYDDSDDLDTHVPIGTDDGITSAGEDDELSVARTLWHFRVDAKIRIPDVKLASLLKAAKATTLSAGVAALLPPTSAVVERNDIACVLTRQAVAPLVTSPGDGSTVSRTLPPTFRWEPHGAGPSHRSNSFVVRVLGPDWSQVRFTSKTVTTTSFTPTKAEWKGVLAAGDTGLHVVVRGTGTDAPKTGPYVSCGVDISEGGDLAAVPFTSSFHAPAVNAVCAGLTSPLDAKFRVSGSALTPSATYDIVLHAEHGGAPDVTLTPVVTTAAGALPSTFETLRGVAGGRSWAVIATPRHDGDIRASVPVDIGAIPCFKSDPDAAHTVVWGGVGAVSGTTVTASSAGKVVSSTVAAADATFQASYPEACSGSKTVQIRYTDLDGPQVMQAEVPCPTR